jgi:hygromycin-B 7''-O-kinase
LIDFGDAMVGDLHYELAALHLDLFDCDKRLLRQFLDHYGGM